LVEKGGEEEVKPDTNVEKTEILYGANHVMNIILQFLSKANRIDSCGDYKAALLTTEIEEYRELLFDLKKRNIKLRYITEITKENIRHCKELMKFVDEFRHLDGIKANFSVSETEYIAYTAAAATATTPTHKEMQSVQQLIYSNVKDIVQQQKYVFESLWSKAIPAEQRIREIEEGAILGKTEIIQSPKDIQQLFINMVKSAKHEVLLVLPSINSFLREERIGIIELLKQAAVATEGSNSINVRILTPTNYTIEKKLQEIVVGGKQEEQEQKKKSFDIRHIDVESYEEEAIEYKEAAEKITVTTVTIVVVDRKESLVIEKKDDSKENFIEAVGIATYSNSKPTVLSYISIFESLWSQVKLYEKLKIHDKMQKEFINIASHEMKTPTQAILGYSDLVQKHPEKREEMLNAISRNDNQEVMVSVKDNGEGIHPEMLPRLFTKFATKSFTGTGLGLFISKSIIEAHGGKMWAKNNSDDLDNGEKGGATFAFTLPLIINRKQSDSKQERASKRDR
jgi:two-component system, OmpR family, sensor histidine kinase VicK